MATTPVYNWPTPDDTDLVKDGAKAIRDLGNAIDTTVSGLPVGLVHINTTSLLSAISTSVDNVFSSDYKKYRITLRVDQSIAQNTFMRMRASGTDATATNYNTQIITKTGTSGVATSQSLNASSFIIGNEGGNEIFMDISNPFLTLDTYFNNNSMNNANTLRLHAGRLNDSVSYDGFTVFVASGILGGQLSVYGYKE